jgi:hypothetical protein
MELKLLHPAGPDDALAQMPNNAAPAVYAAELFSDSTKVIPSPVGTPTATGGLTLGAGVDDTFVVGLKLNIDAGNLASVKSIVIKASLDNNATWGDDVDAIQVTYCESSGISLPLIAANSCDANRVNDVKISKGVVPGLDSQNSVEFVIQPIGVPGAFDASDWFFFNFDVDDLVSFQNTDGTLNLKMEGVYYITATDTKPLEAVTIPIAKSRAGITIAIEANDDPQQIAVDVAKANMEFIKGSVNTKSISLGNITINEADGVKGYDGSTDFDVNGPGTPYTQKKLNLTVTNGPFAASKGANAVYLDVDGISGFTAGTDLPGTVVSDNTVEWKIADDDAKVNALIGKTVEIMVVADGTTEIKPLPSYPLAAMEFIIQGDKGKTTSGKLRPIKDNGTRCTLYNVPDGTAGEGSLDKISIRVTNKTATPGFLIGELVGQNGVSLFAPKKLADIGAFQTIRLYTGEEEAPSVAEYELSQYASRNWGGERAQLKLTSNIQNLEVVATVRNVNGGPQMNVSAGATGSGCDED